MLGRMFIINTPFTFKALWAIVRAFLDEKTANKISLEGSSYQKKLLELVI
jgi:CRAL/TRIO domain